MTKNADTQSEKQTPTLGPERVLAEMETHAALLDEWSGNGDAVRLLNTAANLIRQQAAQLAEREAALERVLNTIEQLKTQGRVMQGADYDTFADGLLSAAEDIEAALTRATAGGE